MSKSTLSEASLEVDYDKGTRVEKLTNAIKKHADYIAHSVIQAFDKGNVKDAVSTLRALYDKFAADKSIKESALTSIKSHLRNLIAEERKDTDDKGEYKAKGTRGASKDKDVGEILYHLDMGTRHLDVLQDYEEVATHKDELASISSTIQNLAQRIRAEIQKSAESAEPAPPATPEQDIA